VDYQDVWTRDIGPKVYASTHPPVDGHFFIESSEINGNGEDEKEIIGFAHSKEGLQKRVYECAVRFGKQRAKEMNGKFEDRTSKQPTSSQSKEPGINMLAGRKLHLRY
jgi:hypothetical protein